MASPARNGTSWFAALRDMPNDRPLKTITVTMLVCLAASIVVAGSAVLLRPAQNAAKERDRQARMVEITAKLPGIGDDLRLGDRDLLEARVVDLASGQVLPAIDAAEFDQRLAAKDPAQSVAIPPELDLAQIKTRSRLAVVYLLRQDGQVKLIILPVRGRGFASMLYGYLGLTGDARRVVGLNFFEHGETPGLGALIDDPTWRDQWRGKEVWDYADNPALGVAQGPVEPGSPEAAHLVDGLTGATWTSRGVTNLLRYWLGEHGFGPYLRTIRDRGGQ